MGIYIIDAYRCIDTYFKCFTIPAPFLTRVDGVTHVPFALLPSPFRTDALHAALLVQPHLNLLLDRVRRDFDFMITTLSTTAEADEFTAQLFEMYRVVETEGVAQRLTLSVHRADYMLQSTTTPPCIKQVVSARGRGRWTCCSADCWYLHSSRGLRSPTLIPTDMHTHTRRRWKSILFRVPLLR